MYKVGNEYFESYSYCKHLRTDVLQVLKTSDGADCIHYNNECHPLDTDVEYFDGAAYIRKLEERLRLYEDLPNLSEENS